MSASLNFTYFYKRGFIWGVEPSNLMCYGGEKGLIFSENRLSFMSPSIDHLTDVGVTKAMGFLHFSEIAALGHCRNCLAARFSDSSRYALRLIEGGGRLWGEIIPENDGVFSVASVPMMLDLLGEHKPLLFRAGWPTDPQSFLERSVKQYVTTADRPYGRALQGMIQRAYNHAAAPKGDIMAQMTSDFSAKEIFREVWNLMRP
jgi:hypothetical protein